MARGDTPRLGASALVFVIVLIFMRERPEDVGLLRYGQDPRATRPASRPLAPLAALAMATRSRAFWVLAGTFFICGASTNGLIGTHLIAACHDVGIPEVRSANLLALMGIFDIAGTTASGWLTDRYSSRWLLFMYYTLRGFHCSSFPHAAERRERPRLVRGLLRPRLDRHRAANRPAGHAKPSVRRTPA